MFYKGKNIYATFLVIISAILITGISHAEIDENSIMAMWLFDEGSGEVAKDSSLNGNDAEFNGNPQWAAGRFGQGISFDGASDYLSAQDSDSLDVGGEEMTIVAWINADGWPASWNHIIRKTPENPRIYILGVHDTSLAFIFLKTEAQQIEDIQGATNLPNGEWIHLAMTYDGAEVRIYVNGEIDATAPASGAIEASADELRIGRGAPGGYFSGALDEIAIFRVALEQDEIKDVMDNGLLAMLAVEPQGKFIETWAGIKASILNRF